MAFANQESNPQKVCAQVWFNLIDYGKAAWNRVVERLKSSCGRQAQVKCKIIEEFKTTWCRGNVLATWVIDHPVWQAFMSCTED